jgi:hypothetical protein
MEDFNWLGFVLGFATTWFIMKAFLWYLRFRNDILKQDLEEVSKKIKETIIKVNIEKHGDIFYIFEKETDNFVAQGKDIAEIKKVMLERFPKKTFVATEDQLKESGLE